MGVEIGMWALGLYAEFKKRGNMGEDMLSQLLIISAPWSKVASKQCTRTSMCTERERATLSTQESTKSSRLPFILPTMEQPTAAMTSVLAFSATTWAAANITLIITLCVDQASIHSCWRWIQTIWNIRMVKNHESLWFVATLEASKDNCLSTKRI